MTYLSNLLKLFLLVFAICSFNLNAYSKVISPNKNYEGIVLGKIINKNVKKIGSVYLTEYKLKTKRWLYKKPNIRSKKYITIKILGADLPEKGISIKTSYSPEYIPENKEAIFLLEKTNTQKDSVYTLTKDGVVY